MKRAFSSSWKASKKPAKQRKYRFRAPLHVRNSFLSAHLSKELRKKHGRRSITLRTGDKVTIMRGQFKGKSGRVERVNTVKCTVTISGIEMSKKDGTKSTYPINVSNLSITEINLDDKKRYAGVQRTAPPKK